MAIAGIDVGGTFTDVFIRDRDRDSWVVHKAPSTPPDFSRGFMTGLEQALAKADVSPGAVERLVHGTTVATNCILTRRGARLGLVMTEGFRDVLYIGVGWRPRMYDLDMDPVEPLFLAPRRRALGVRERMDAQGRVVTPLDEEHLRNVAQTLVGEQGAEVLVVCFLHAYANPAHERRAREILTAMYPDVDVTLSSDVLPRRREYRRLVVSGFDGYVKPVVTNYLRGLVEQLGSAGVSGPLHIMQSHGGVGGVGNIIERPVNTVLSGLAAGVIGAANVAASAGFPDCISLDMGGTSTDVALIRGGRALISNDGSFADYPLNIPMIDVQTIGAGGSSIAYVDEGGALKVGPQSAGADPGPACYGRGGEEPTVTDAGFVLGYLNPETFAGGLDLDIGKSRQVIEEKIAEPLGLSLLEAALGIQAIVNNNMAQTLRLVSIKRGHDPRDFALIAFGGAGPLSAGKLAEAASIGTILIPTAPGVLSAMGLMLAPIQHESMTSFEVAAAEASLDELRARFAALDDACRAKMRDDGVNPGDASIEYRTEMRYIGQSHELEVTIAPQDADAIDGASRAFHEAHQRAYSHCDENAPVEFVTLRSVHYKESEETTLLSESAAAVAGSPTPRHRKACLDSTAGLEDVPVYRRDDLPAGFELTGPAIIEQADTTTLIYPGHQARLDSFRNILIDVPVAAPGDS